MHSESQTVAVTIINYKPLSDLRYTRWYDLRYTQDGMIPSCVPQIRQWFIVVTAAVWLSLCIILLRI